MTRWSAETPDASHLHHEWRRSKLSVSVIFRISELRIRDCGNVLVSLITRN